MQVYYNNTIVPDNRIQNQTVREYRDNQSVNSFQDILESKIIFSKHANMRLTSREINLSDDQIKRVSDGVSKAGKKGISESLVLVDNVALVVNIKNRLVITAMGGENDNIFTNIDGAVIV
jgi:flagellar operon protein